MILNLLKRWAWRRRRSIFPFFDGTAARWADPMAVYRELQRHPRFNWDIHPALIDTGDLDALAVTAEAVRSAFGLKDAAAGGLTEAECVALLARFVAYLDALKKNGSPAPILPEPTGRAFSTPTTPGTNAPSASGSTVSEPRPAAPSAS